MLYFGLLKNHAICRWDSYRPFTYENQQIVARDDTHIQWTDGLLNLFNLWEKTKTFNVIFITIYFLII